MKKNIVDEGTFMGMSANKEEYSMIERAAAIEHRTLAGFLKHSVLRNADSVIADEVLRRKRVVSKKEVEKNDGRSGIGG